MRQLRNGVGFALEVFRLLLAQMGMQHLDRRLLIKAHMLPQIHLGKDALPQQGDQPIVAKVLAKSIGHRCLLPSATLGSNSYIPPRSEETLMTPNGRNLLQAEVENNGQPMCYVPSH